MLHIQELKDFFDQQFSNTNIDETLNEAFNIDAGFIEEHIMKNKAVLLEAAATQNTYKFLKQLNVIFKNRFLFKDKTKLNIDKLVKELAVQIEELEEKVTKYPQITFYLKEEIKENQTFIRFLKNKRNNKILISFVTYNQHHNLERKGWFSKASHWLKRKMIPTLKYMEYDKNRNYIKRLKAHDFRVFSAQHNFIENDFKVIFDNHAGKTVNPDNINIFAKLMRSILKHELIHQRDYLNKTVQELRNNDMYQYYYLKNTEIKAYAANIIEEFKMNGFEKDEIEEILLRPSKNLQKVKSSNDLFIYYNYFYEHYKFYYYMLVSECLDVLNEKWEKEIK